LLSISLELQKDKKIKESKTWYCKAQISKNLNRKNPKNSENK